VIDLKLNVQEAIEAPRWQHLNAPGLNSAEESGLGVLQIEDRVSADVLEELKARGHQVLPLSPWGHGSSAQLMEVLANGTHAFGSDPRCEGHASGI
jgi:gamma-glutamyltranspeptidase/glutathione hydrolase